MDTLAEADALIASGAPTASALFSVIDMNDITTTLGHFSGDAPWPVTKPGFLGIEWILNVQLEPEDSLPPT